jgi:hypothetical protein
MPATTYPGRVNMEAIRDWIASNAELADHKTAAFLEGKKHVFEHAGFPRYVWYPTLEAERDRDEVADAPNAADLEAYEAEYGAVEPYGEPTGDVDSLRIQVHAWGADDADAWALMREVRRAVRGMDLSAAITFQGATFARAEEGAELDYGSEVVFALDIKIPITMAAATTVAIDATSATTRVQDSLEDGC